MHYRQINRVNIIINCRTILLTSFSECAYPCFQSYRKEFHTSSVKLSSEKDFQEQVKDLERNREKYGESFQGGMEKKEKPARKRLREIQYEEDDEEVEDMEDVEEKSAPLNTPEGDTVFDSVPDKDFFLLSEIKEMEPIDFKGRHIYYIFSNDDKLQFFLGKITLTPGENYMDKKNNKTKVADRFDIIFYDEPKKPYSLLLENKHYLYFHEDPSDTEPYEASNYVKDSWLLSKTLPHTTSTAGKSRKKKPKPSTDESPTISNSSSSDVASSSSSSIPVTSGKNWICPKTDRKWTYGAVEVDSRSTVKNREAWSVTVDAAATIAKGDGIERPLSQYFITAFPMSYLNTILELTNAELNKLGSSTTSNGKTRTNQKDYEKLTAGEFFKFVGVLILITFCKNGELDALWSKKSDERSLLPPMNFGKLTGMARDRFQTILRCLKVSKTSVIPRESSSEIKLEARWSIIKDFVDAINLHKENTIKCSADLCVDESMIRWYGLGGPWLDVGLPHYVSIDRKPEDGAEMWTLCDGHGGFLLRMEICMGELTSKKSFAVEYNQGTAVAARLVEPFRDPKRAVYADSWFASMELCQFLREKFDMYFTGVVKTATSGFPASELNEVKVDSKGQWASMTHTSPKGDEYIALTWIDRTRRNFISSHGKTTSGAPCVRLRASNAPDGDGCIINEISLEQPHLVEQYYKFCAIVDRHNRCRQDSLGMERALETKSWHKRFITSLISMLLVDAFLFYKGSRSFTQTTLTQRNFMEYLAKELIENSYDNGPSRAILTPHKNPDVTPSTRRPSPSTVDQVWLTPNKDTTLEKRKNRSPIKRIVRSGCVVCGLNSPFKCSSCGKKICGYDIVTEYGCITKHIEVDHPHMTHRISCK